MRLIIVHYHLRPGGVRRVIELAAPPVAAAAPRPVTEVVLAVGEPAEAEWHERFSRLMAGSLRGQSGAGPAGGWKVEVRVVPAFGYASGPPDDPRALVPRLRRAVEELVGTGPCLAWVQNPGVGRNLWLARVWAEVCGERGVPLVFHHHDWWFDNRWARWPGIRRQGFGSLAAAARALFPSSGRVVHAAINQADASVLARHAGLRAVWLPNPVEKGAPPAAASVRAARQWLRDRLGGRGTPVWLVPCRTLRRKNLGEALLLAQWLRPEARVLVTGGVSSADEEPYGRALAAAVRRHRWPLELGVLAASRGRGPGVADLLAVSEAVLFTSIQEGFGLPYLEAAAAGRPLVARRLPNIMPDLEAMGFRFPHSYDEIVVAPELLDWKAERGRQASAFRTWRAGLPSVLRRRAGIPFLLDQARPCPVPFSRLTLAGQLDVLQAGPEESWRTCRRLNPFLDEWKERAARGALRAAPWPAQAGAWLGGEAYARRFHEALAAASSSAPVPLDSQNLQDEFIGRQLSSQNLFPLLWSAGPAS